MSRRRKPLRAACIVEAQKTETSRQTWGSRRQWGAKYSPVEVEKEVHPALKTGEEARGAVAASDREWLSSEDVVHKTEKN